MRRNLLGARDDLFDAVNAATEKNTPGVPSFLPGTYDHTSRDVRLRAIELALEWYLRPDADMTTAP